MKKIIRIYPQLEFDEMMEKMGLNDENIENETDLAIISICGCKDAIAFWGDTDEHWFKQNHSNVLNLDFDDVYEENIDYTVNADGEEKIYHFNGMKMEQAREAIKFIEANLGKNFIVHCRAGQSRSQGFFRFMVNNYSDYFSYVSGNPYRLCFTPNSLVVSQLKRAYMEKEGLLEKK